MFCFTCYGHLAIRMLGAVLVFYSVEWRDSFLSPPLNLHLSNRVFASYPPDRPRRHTVSTRPYPPDCPRCRATSTRPYPPDRPRCCATSTRPYSPNRPRCRATSTRRYPPDRPRCCATSTRQYPPDCPRCRATSTRPYPSDRPRHCATSTRLYPPDHPHPRHTPYLYACLGPVSTPTASVIPCILVEDFSVKLLASRNANVFRLHPFQGALVLSMKGDPPACWLRPAGDPFCQIAKLP